MKYLGKDRENRDRRLREKIQFLRFACQVLEAYIERIIRKNFADTTKERVIDFGKDGMETFTRVRNLV
jgi:hypothetical protein